MTAVLPLSAFLRLISLLRLTEVMAMAVLSFAEILSKGVRKTTEASSSFVSSKQSSRSTEFWIGGCHVDLTWTGGAEVFLFFANIYFKRLVLAKLLKVFSKDLLELGTGGVGINLRPLERSLTSSLERALLEKCSIYFSF